MPSTPPLFAADGVAAPSVTLAMAATGSLDGHLDVGADSATPGAAGAPPAPSRADALFRPPMSYLRRSTTGPAADHDLRKERERRELVEMILESIASVPVAVERIHTNSKLRAALTDAMGEEHALLGRFFSFNAGSAKTEEKERDEDDETLPESLSAENLRRWDEAQRHDRGALPHEIFSDYSSDAKRETSGQDDSDEDSSGFGSEYEKDLAEAVNQLCMSDEALTAMEKQLSVPIHIASKSSEGANGSSKLSNSPNSSLCLSASPGAALLLDGEPVSAIWPRQPNQFAFTQEEETTQRGEDEVYSEMVSSLCEDDSLHDEDEGDGGGKLFEMENDEEGLDNELSSYRHQQRTMNEADRETFEDVGRESSTAEPVVEGENGDEEEDDGDDDDYDDSKREYEIFQLRIIREKNHTGFEPNQDWRPRPGRLIAGRYKVQMAIGEAVFSRTYKCIDVTTNQTVCLKIIKNNKEYFDQGVDEIRVMEVIARSCNVDEKHVVRLIDYFYFREHLIIVTELLRDNLYEFSRLLMERGVINYFNMARLKKIAIEVLEALQLLHSIGLVHCDLKPENILVSNFNQCTVKVIDFGSACYVTDELTSYVQSRSYRAPEVILGLVYDQKIDMWSLGCVLAELFTGEVLFKNDSEQTLLARIIATIGPIPASLLMDREDLQKQLEENPVFAVDTAGNGVLASTLLLPPLEAAVQASDTQFLAFLRALLQIDPAARLSATEALAHPWLQSGVYT